MTRMRFLRYFRFENEGEKSNRTATVVHNGTPVVDTSTHICVYRHI